MILLQNEFQHLKYEILIPYNSFHYSKVHVYDNHQTENRLSMMSYKLQGIANMNK